MYGTAIGWGMLPDSEAQYFSYYSKGDVANPKIAHKQLIKRPI